MIRVDVSLSNAEAYTFMNLFLDTKEIIQKALPFVDENIQDYLYQR